MADAKTAAMLVPSPVAVDGRVNTIRLASVGDQPIVAMLVDDSSGIHPVRIAALDGAAREIIPGLAFESPFGTPSWDVIGAEAGLAAVWTRPGSAISPLGYRTPKGTETILTGQYPSGVFQGPRFVRGEPRAPLAVTAVAPDREGGIVLALFADALDGGHSAQVPLPSVGPGLLADGLLLRDGPEYLLFVKLLPPGPRGAERRDGRGESIMPGALYCVRLNAKLEPAGAAERLLDGTPVFEFDADLAAGRVYLLATAADGSVAATARVTSEALRWIMRHDPARDGGLTSPTVLASATPPLAAAIASATTSHPEILIGSHWPTEGSAP